jgi:hypothetical protein
MDMAYKKIAFLRILKRVLPRGGAMGLAEPQDFFRHGCFFKGFISMCFRVLRGWGKNF